MKTTPNYNLGKLRVWTAKDKVSTFVEANIHARDREIIYLQITPVADSFTIQPYENYGGALMPCNGKRYRVMSVKEVETTVKSIVKEARKDYKERMERREHEIWRNNN